MPEVVWEGYDSAEESGDEIEDYDWEEGDEEGAGEEGGEQGGEEGHEEDEEGEDEDEDEDEDDAEEAEEDDGEEGEEGEDEATRQTREDLRLVREHAVPVSREQVANGAALWCWQDDEKKVYFPIVATQTIPAKAKKVHCNTLLPADENRLFKIDPHFKAEDVRNRAWMRYLFTVPWERLVKVDGEEAWKVSRARRE